MQKRGQLTIFIIIGIVILLVLGIIFFMMYKPKPPQVVPEQFSDVQKYVDGCVEQTLRDGITFLGRGPNPDYNNNLADYIKQYLVYCPNFTADFPDLEVRQKDIVSVAVSMNDDKSLVSAVVVYPVVVTKSGYTKTLERFYAEYPLVAEYNCASVPVDAACKAKISSPLTVKVGAITFTFKPDDFVGIGNTCIACK